MMADDPEASFFSRWSRRKLAPRDELVEVAENPHPHPAPPAKEGAVGFLAPAMEPSVGVGGQPPAETAEPAPTLADVADLTPQSDYTRFVARGVAPEVKNAALKKLFTDPHFNIMDGLDTYIEDYGQPDPLPPGMLRQMVQSKMLGLFDDEDELEKEDLAAPPQSATLAAPTALPLTAPDEDTDLHLQPDHDAGRAGLAPGVEPHAGRQR